jgi:predicted dehydrogenase
MLKIALIGCGIWGQKILYELISLNVVIGVYDPNIEIKKTIKKIEKCKFFTEWCDLSTYDGIILATPSSLHKEHLEKIIPFDIPIFVEKPITASLTDALRINKLSVNKIFLMHTWTYHPGIIMLKDIIISGELGYLHSIHSTRANWTSPRNDVDSVWNLAPHDITIAKTLLGYIPAPTYALSEKYNGVIRRFIGILGDKQTFLFDVSNRYENKVRTIRMNFENAVVFFDAENTNKNIKIIYGDANSSSDGMKIEYKNYSPESALTLEIKDFVEYLQSGRMPRNTFADGLEVVKTIDKLINLSEGKK